MLKTKIRKAVNELEAHWPRLDMGSPSGPPHPPRLRDAIGEYCARPANRDGRGVKSSVLKQVLTTLRHVKSASIRATPGAPREIRTKARKLLKRLYHERDFAQAAILARTFGGELQRCGRRSARLRPVCRPSSALLGEAASFGQVYLERVVSIADLMHVGRALHQCVAHADATGRGYHDLLRRRESEFWQIRAREPLALLQVDDEDGERRVVEVGTRDDPPPRIPTAMMRRVLCNLRASGDEEPIFQQVGAFWCLRHSPEPTAIVDIGNGHYRIWRHHNEISVCERAAGKPTWSRFRRRPVVVRAPRRLPAPRARRRGTRAAARGIGNRWERACWTPDSMDEADLLGLLCHSQCLYEVLRS